MKGCNMQPVGDDIDREPLHILLSLKKTDKINRLTAISQKTCRTMMDHMYTFPEPLPINPSKRNGDSVFMSFPPATGQMECESSPFKRIRLSDPLPQTPQLSNSIPTHMTPEISTCSSTTEDEQPVTEWWKKKPQREVNRNRSDACAVCQRIMSSTTSAFRQSPCIHDSRGLRDTSLLTFFKPNSQATRPVNPRHFPMTRREDSECAFCEKNVCQDCIAKCEECRQFYCKFCRTIDYDTDGFTDRVLCLDCNSERAIARTCVDSMNIG